MIEWDGGWEVGGWMDRPREVDGRVDAWSEQEIA